MNYQLHYDRLMERARHREVVGYVERHHIRPRCLGGSNQPSNIARLTPEEHHCAHQLLVRIYPTHFGLIGAAMLLGAGFGNRSGNKIYGWLRRRWIDSLKDPETRQKMSAIHKLKTIPAEQREKMRAGLLAYNAKRKAEYDPAFPGPKRIVSPERRAKLSAANKGKVLSISHKQKMSDAKRGKKQSDEHKAKVAAFHTGRKRSLETIAKMRAAQLGKRTGPQTEAHKLKAAAARTGKKRSEATIAKMRERMLGVRLSEATKRKLSEANKGKRLSPETLAKISLALKGRKFTPEHIAKIVEARRGIRHTEEAKAKMSASQQRRFATKSAASGPYLNVAREVAG